MVQNTLLKKVILGVLLCGLTGLFLFFSLQYFLFSCKFAFEKDGRILIPLAFRLLYPLAAIFYGIVLQKLCAVVYPKEEARVSTQKPQGLSVEKILFFLPPVLLITWPLYANLPFADSPFFWIFMFAIWWGILYFRLFAQTKPIGTSPIVLWALLLLWGLLNGFHMLDSIATFLYRLMEGDQFFAIVPFPDFSSPQYTACALYFSYVFHYPLLMLGSFLISRFTEKRKILSTI